MTLLIIVCDGAVEMTESEIDVEKNELEMNTCIMKKVQKVENPILHNA